MAKSNVVPNMPGRERPELATDRQGYDPERGDYDWEHKLKRLYKKVPGGWILKN